MLLSSLLNVANIFHSAHFALGFIGLFGLHRDFCNYVVATYKSRSVEDLEPSSYGES